MDADVEHRLLNTAQCAREVAMVTAMALIASAGDAETAKVALAAISTKYPVRLPNELDVAGISVQAINDALATFERES